MSTADARPTPRRSAPERREEIVTIAIEHFAVNGYKGTSTDQVAREAGISQPYLFRLFHTKRDLFLACHTAMHDRIGETFAAAARGAEPGERLTAMGGAYVELLRDRTSLLFQMQSYAACSDAEIRAQVRRCYGALVGQVRELSGAADAELWRFFSSGMLMNVVASLDLAEIAAEDPWAALWTQPESLLQEG